jgi:hypothetical protein
MLRLDVLYHFGCHLRGINLHAGEDATKTFEEDDPSTLVVAWGPPVINI